MGINPEVYIWLIHEIIPKVKASVPYNEGQETFNSHYEYKLMFIIYNYINKSGTVGISLFKNASEMTTLIGLDRIFINKNPHHLHDEDFKIKLAATYSPALAVPSALEGLTSVFGMGTGEPLC